MLLHERAQLEISESVQRKEGPKTRVSGGASLLANNVPMESYVDMDRGEEEMEKNNYIP